MYTDPTKLRSNTIKVRLNDEEAALVQAFVNYNGGQTAALIRDIILEQAASVLGVNDTPPTCGFGSPLRVAG